MSSKTVYMSNNCLGNRTVHNSDLAKTLIRKEERTVAQYRQADIVQSPLLTWSFLFRYGFVTRRTLWNPRREIAVAAIALKTSDGDERALYGQGFVRTPVCGIEFRVEFDVALSWFRDITSAKRLL